MHDIFDDIGEIVEEIEAGIAENGSDFNIFDILQLSTNEVRMHSAFVAHLLDSRAPHGFGGRFLDEFIRQQLLKHGQSGFGKRLAKLSPKKITSRVEYYVGTFGDGQTSGIIDILLTDWHENNLIIENKIYAGDQYRQLERYAEHFPGAPIFYLTLNGDIPSSQSSGNLELNNHYACVSYKDDIVKWLKECKSISDTHRSLPSTIGQYICLINKLTYQTPQQKMKEKIADLIISSPEYFAKAHEIVRGFDLAKQRTFDVLKEQLTIEADRLGLQLDFNVSLSERHSGFSFFHSELERLNLRITFEFESANADGLLYGLAYINPDGDCECLTPEQISKFVKLTGISKVSSPWWVRYSYFDDAIDWGFNEYLGILEGSLMKEIMDKVRKIMEALCDIDDETFRFIKK